MGAYFFVAHFLKLLYRTNGHRAVSPCVFVNNSIVASWQCCRQASGALALGDGFAHLRVGQRLARLLTEDDTYTSVIGYIIPTPIHKHVYSVAEAHQRHEMQP